MIAQAVTLVWLVAVVAAWKIATWIAFVVRWLVFLALIVLCVAMVIAPVAAWMLY